MTANQIFNGVGRKKSITNDITNILHNSTTKPIIFYEIPIIWYTRRTIIRFTYNNTLIEHFQIFYNKSEHPNMGRSLSRTINNKSIDLKLVVARISLNGT